MSAVLMHDFLSHHAHRDAIVLHPVNYHLNDTWQSSRLDQPCAVVDFLYHPDAHIWFDHHATTFLTPALRDDFLRRRGQMLVYDPTASSCAVLLWRRLHETSTVRADYADMVHAADRIDSARYDSPEEAVFSDAPALRINASLAVGEAEAYSKHLVLELVSHTLVQVADSPDVRGRYQQFADLRDRGLERFRAAAYLADDGIVVFDVDGSGVLISRYAPFLFFPQARYSLGLVRDAGSGKITAMRNPWMDFPSVGLGEIFAQFGGGGHQRVASTRVRGGDPGSASHLLRDILRAIRAAMAVPAHPASP